MKLLNIMLVATAIVGTILVWTLAFYGSYCLYKGD